MPRVIFDYGEVVRARNNYTDPDTGDPVDPTSLSVTVRFPDRTTATYEYQVDPELTRLALGSYQFLFPLEQVGTYKWYWTAGTADGPSIDYDECDSQRKF